MIEDLTQPLDVGLLGWDGAEYRGRLAQSAFKRLRAELAEAPDMVSVKLRFTQDESGRRRLDGALETELTLICQRCLQPMRLPVTTAFRLALLAPDEDPALLPGDVEPVVLSAAHLDVMDLLEDELLLCLPMAPRHDATAPCDAPLRRPGSTFGEAERARQSPFAVLRELPLKQTPENH